MGPDEAGYEKEQQEEEKIPTKCFGGKQTGLRAAESGRSRWRVRVACVQCPDRGTETLNRECTDTTWDISAE
jgi:hypothetical protein